MDSAPGAPAPSPGAQASTVNRGIVVLGERDAYLLRLFLQLQSRGLGTYRIGRLLWPSIPPRTAQKRVQRLLGRARRLGLPVDSPGEALALLARPTDSNGGGPGGPPGRRRVETPGPPFVETTRRRVSTGEEDAVEGTPRLGRTQRLAVAALRALRGGRGWPL